MSSTFDLVFRTDDVTRWGDGKGANLTPTEVDLNFWILLELFLSLEENPTLPAEIVSITTDGDQMTVTLSDTSSYTVTIPTDSFTWRGNWTPFTSYDAFDLFNQSTGLFLVLQDHTSASTFDSAASNMAGAIYKLLVQYPVAFDIGFFFPGLPGTGIEDSNPIFAYSFARSAFLDTDTFQDSVAGIDVSFTAETVFDIVQSSDGIETTIGSLTFGTGSAEDYVFDLTADVQFLRGDKLKVMKPASVDETGFNLTVTIVATRGDLEGPSSS